MNQSGHRQGTPKEESVSQIGAGMDSSPHAIEPSTKGTTNNIRHSQMAFANDIAQGLIHEVRKLQTTIQEKDRLLKEMEINMADGEKEKELAQRYLRQKTINEEKLKEDNWNLEVANQDLQTNQSELNQTIAKLNVDHKKCLQDLRASLEQMEIIKAQQEKTSATTEAMKARHDHEQQLLRRNNGILHRDMGQLKKQLEAANIDLKICRSKLAIKATVDSNNTSTLGNHQQSYGNNRDSIGGGENPGPLDDGDTTKINVTSNTSNLAAISQQRALEIDTLKQSLGHAHRMISSLRNNLQKEKVEKIELKKMLMDTQESMDQLQKSVANHDTSHTGRGQSKKTTSGVNRTKVVRKRGALGRKTMAATTKAATEDFSGDRREDFSTVETALNGNDDINLDNGIRIRSDQDDFLSCDDDTSMDDSSSMDECNNADSDSGAENDCHQLDLAYTGQGQSLDMELKLGGFDTPFKPLSSELEETFVKRQYVDKGVNTTTSDFEQVSLHIWQQSKIMNDSAEIATPQNDTILPNSNEIKPKSVDGSEIANTKDDNILLNSKGIYEGSNDIGIGTETESDNTTFENTHDINYNSNGPKPEQDDSSTAFEKPPLSSAILAHVNHTPLDSAHSPIPISSTANQPMQQQQHMDSKSQLVNTDAQHNTVSHQEGMVTPLPGSPVSSQHPTIVITHEQQESLVTNTGSEPYEPISKIEKTSKNSDRSANKIHSSASLTNDRDDNTQSLVRTIEQNPTENATDNELAISTKQTQKSSTRVPSASLASPVSNNSSIQKKSNDENYELFVGNQPAQLDGATESSPADDFDKSLEFNILALPATHKTTTTVGEPEAQPNGSSALATKAEEIGQETNEEYQWSTVSLEKYDSLDTYNKSEPLGDNIAFDNQCQSAMDISNMLSRDEAEALIKAGIAEALEKERVEAATRQQQNLGNNFVTLAEAEAMARDRTEAALKKERNRTSTMLTKNQADLMARAYAEQAIQENDKKRYSHEITTSRTTSTTSSFLARVKTTTTTASMQDEPSIGRASTQRRTSQTSMAPTPTPASPQPQPSTSTASTATTSSTSSRRSILSGLMKLQPSISTPAKTMRLRPSASTSSLRKTTTNISSTSSSASRPLHTQRQISNNALHHRYKSTADQHLQPPPTCAPSYGTVRITETSTYPRKPSSTHHRKPSLQSLSSNLSSKSGLMPTPAFAFPVVDGDPSQHHSSAELISAITQTMIGEWMWKHTRKHMGGGISENKHKRFFWVHPYTRTLYWGNNEPGVDADEAKAKSAFIESVSSIPSSDAMGASPLSLLIKTAKRDLKLTAQSLDRHELWRMSLSYLLVPPGEDYSAVEDVIQVDPFHNDHDSTTPVATTGAASTQTLPIAATEATCRESSLTDDDTQDEATTNDDCTILPPTQQDSPKENENSNSKVQDSSNSTKSSDHDMEVMIKAG